MLCDEYPIIKRAKITPGGPRGLLSNYPSDVVYVINGQPITKADILAAKRHRQQRELAAKRRVCGPIVKPAFVWVFFNSSDIYYGWYLYIRTAKQAYSLRGYCFDEKIILKVMERWPCGCLPFVENLRNWMPAFARQYHRSTRKRPKKQGLAICWVRVERGCVTDVYTVEEYAELHVGRVSIPDIGGKVEKNPLERSSGRWFQLAQYPEGVIVCPFCHLPETDRVYERECQCWDRGDEVEEKE